MEQDAKDDVATDTIHDDALRCSCTSCVLARLCDRQHDAIASLTRERDEEKRLRMVYGSQVAALKEEIAAHVRGEA